MSLQAVDRLYLMQGITVSQESAPMENYTTETKITFTAVGAGMDIENPIKGDVRYQPLNWEVLEARSWDGAPYSATSAWARMEIIL